MNLSRMVPTALRPAADERPDGLGLDLTGLLVPADGSRSATDQRIADLQEQLQREQLHHMRTQEALTTALAENRDLRGRLEKDNAARRRAMEQCRTRMVGKSDALHASILQAESVAASETPVLLLGETGTGKELLAQTIHSLSRRRERPLVAVNCASLPPTLVEGELFGREAGAYTGAISRQAGRFEAADGSTLFLDEIGDMPAELQAKLLRVLEDGRFERLGSSKTIRVNVRVVAASNRDLRKAVREGRFRCDLFHRLNVFPIRVPPLRERAEDIPLLVWSFVEEFGRRMGKTITTIPRRDMDQLQQYPWPGNVRELSNVVERAMILATGDTLHIELPATTTTAPAWQMTLDELEKMHIRRVLDETMWRVRGTNGAAQILGVKPTTLEARMAKLGIRRER